MAQINSNNKVYPGGFAQLPRALRRCVMEGAICRNEFLVYAWLLILEFRGIAETSFSQIAAVLGLDAETVRKVCYRLKAKKFIDFIMEQGRRSFTKFIILELPFETTGYKSNGNKEKEVKLEVPPEVTSLPKDSTPPVTTIESSSQQDAELPNLPAYNNKDIKEYNRLTELIKKPLTDKELQVFNDHIINLGTVIINKAIDLAVQSKMPMHSFSYFCGCHFLENAKKIVKDEKAREEEGENFHKKIKEYEINAGPPSEEQKKIIQAFIKGGMKCPDF